MSVAGIISNRVKRMQKGRPFAGAVFMQVGSRASVDKAPSWLVQSGVALTALYYIGKEGLSSEVVSKVTDALSSEELNKLLACKMPEWMRSILSSATKETE